MKRNVAIIGGGQTYHAARRHDVDQGEMVNEAVRRALADANMTMDEIDAVFLGNMEFFEGVHLTDCWLVNSTGAYGKPGVKVTTGGTVGATTTCVGAHHVASGLFDRVLCIGFEKQEEGDTNAILSGVAHPLWGRNLAGGAIGYFAMMASAYMSLWKGATPEHSAMVAVKARQNARKNEYAHLKLDITVKDVLESRVLTDPIRMLEMCPASNGACAMILAEEKTAKKRSKKPVWIRAMDTAHNEQFVLDWRDVQQTRPIFSRVSAARLYKKLGVTKPAEYFDVFEVYEPVTWAEILWYEDLGLCAPGEGFRMIEKGMTDIEGPIPVNPSGGVLSTNCIGASAMLRVWEAALQIRGDAGEHQVPKDVRRAMTTAYGGTNWTVTMGLSKTLDD
ncbi:MAG: propanoyl-CoA acyltransferase [Deltaproteobacteria bacterium HGW-Deltaproteobacteria-12]|jgi:acetyl-CoA C-acetyltransferase|nr:MAG: propanoyl-CoA acyltransferase [Deltaproteobacteria bacterium HGW-Deltaproteobacteria-12]